MRVAYADIGSRTFRPPRASDYRGPFGELAGEVIGRMQTEGLTMLEVLLFGTERDGVVSLGVFMDIPGGGHGQILAVVVEDFWAGRSRIDYRKIICINGDELVNARNLEVFARYTLDEVFARYTLDEDDRCDSVTTAIVDMLYRTFRPPARP